MKRILKIFAGILAGIILLLLIGLWMLSLEKIQNILAQKAASYLAGKLKTRVEIAHVRIAFFNAVDLQGLYIEDKEKDTLAYVGTLRLKTSDLLSNYWHGHPATIYSAGLHNAFVRLHRNKDSCWNYDFIASAFSSPQTSGSQNNPSDTTTATNGSGGLDFDLKHIEGSHIRFFMDDGWRGEDIDFTVGEFNLQTEQLAFDENRVRLREINIDGADVLVREYQGNKPEDLSPDDTTDWGTPFNPENFGLHLAKLKLSNSRFRYIHDGRVSLPNEFDEKNLVIAGINLDLTDTRIIGDTIFSTIDHLQATERCGLAVKDLQAEVRLSQVHAALDQLTLQTNYSTVKGHYEMNYKNFHAFNEYISEVNMKGHLAESRVSSLDIGYFANILNQYPIAVNVNGDFDGTVDHLEGTNLSLESRNTRFSGDALVTGLPDIDQTFFNVRDIDLQTSGSDINALIPQTKTEGIDWKSLSRIHYTGQYNGQVDQFYTRGNLSTSLGNAILDLDMNFRPDIPTYSGHIETDDFNIGQLIRQSRFGTISMKGKIDGSGFNLDDLNAQIDATVSRIDLDTSHYHDITVNGIVAKKKFDGIFISKDPGLTLNFNGKVDLNGTRPVYQFTSRFIRFDLKKFGLTKESIIGSGYANLNFDGATLDDFTGSASFKGIILENKGKTTRIDSLLLESYQSTNEKVLRLTSSVVDAEVKGKFYLSGLPDAIQLYLYHYLPQYISLPATMSNQELEYNVEIHQADSILNTFASDFQGVSGSAVSGYLNTNSQRFGLDANILRFGYKAFRWEDIIIVGSGDYKQFDLNATCGNFFYHNDLMIPSFQVNGSMASDTANLSLITQSINEVLGDATLNIKATALNNNLYVNILPSTFSLRDDNWQLRSNDDLVFGKKMSISDVVIESGAQRIMVNSSEHNSDDLVIDLQELDLYGLSNYIDLSGVRIFGRMNGKVELNNLFTAPVAEASLYSTGNVRINDDTLGQVFARVHYAIDENQLRLDPGTKISRYEQTSEITGKLNFATERMQLKATLEKADIAFLNEFIIDYVSDLHGTVTGSLNLTGPIDGPDVSGQLVLSQASLKVIYLGTRYTLENAKLNFTNYEMRVEEFNLYDERPEKYAAKVKGSVELKQLENPVFNLSISSPNFLCLNTLEWDNDLYYGYVPASLTGRVSGALDDISMDINAKPLKGATFHLPISSSGDASTYDYIDFVRIGKDQFAEKQKKSNNYFRINMNVEATPDAEVFIILDQNTREEIVAKGNGSINLNLDLGNSMNMFGTYSITEGKYLFNFRGVLPRTFIIDEGSQIRWNGDPLAAQLDVKAIYKLPNALPLYPLIQGLTDDENELAEAKKKYDTYINLALKDNLSAPEISFDINQPNNKAIGTMAYEKLMLIKNDEKELVSQAGVLLLLGEFKSAERIETGSYERGGVATASDLISNALSSGLTNVFSEVTGLKNISLNMNYKTYSLSQTQSNINQFNFGITANLFKERMLVDFGSNVDVDRSNTTGKGVSTVNIGGDFKAQYLVTDDGRLRINAYRTSNYNAEGNSIMKGGMGLSYKKVFNSLRDLFTSKPKKNKASNNPS